MANPWLFFTLGYLLLAASLAFQFFVVLSGTTEAALLNRIYFLQANTTAISGAPDISRWTFFSICSEVDGLNADCSKITAALEFAPAYNFGSSTGVPDSLVNNTANETLSKTMFALFIIALFLNAFSFFGGISAWVRHPGTKLQKLLGILALLSQLGGAVVMTVWTINGRKAFVGDGDEAYIGVMAYGFSWGAVGCELVYLVLIKLYDGTRPAKPAANPDPTFEDESGLVAPMSERDAAYV